MNLASLGLAVDSRPVASAAQDLDRITDAAKRAEKQADSFGAKTEAAGRRAAAANDNAARAARRVVASLEFERAQLGRNAAQQAIHNNLRIAGATAATAEGRAIIAATVALQAEQAAMKANEAVLARRAALLGKVRLAAAGLAAGVVAFGGSGVPGARDLSASLAEASTLIEGTDDELQRIQAAARDMGREFGTTAASQVKAFYQAISAGATDIGQATLLLESANKVAIGGITDTVTAVDVLTTATNAYAASGLTASNASDALFVGMRAGKTTISELASSLGQVIPIAASLGVNFDELVAGVAALTTQGQSTAQAVTGVRAILSQVAKPADEATKLAKKLGLEFNTTSLQAKGLSGFLDDVIAKTGGNVDAMAKLFGSVEALNAALSFAGGGGDAFTKILGDMANKAGAADAAYQKVAESLDKRLGNALNRIADVAVRFGEALLTVIVPAAEAFASALELIADNAADLAIILAPIAAVHLVKMVAGFASLAAGMNAAAVAARALSIAMAFMGGPVGLALTAASAALVVLTGGFSGARKSAIDYAAAQDIVSQAMADSSAPTRTATKEAIAKAQADLQAAQALLQRAEAELVYRQNIASSIPQLPGAPDPLAKVNDKIAKFRADVYALGMVLKDLNQRADAPLATPPGTPPRTPPALSLGDSTKEKKDPYAEIVRGARQFIEAQKLEAQALGMTEQAANRLRYEQDLLNKAANDNIKLTPAMTAELKLQAEQMAAAEAATARLTEAYNFNKDAAKGFLSSLRQDLRNGELSWQSFGNAALSVLDKIVDKLEDQVATAFANAFTPRGGGGGGGGLFGSILGGLFGGGGSAFNIGNFYAKGGAFDRAGEITAFAKGGVVGRATVFPFAKGVGLMGEAGPEAIMPLRRGADGSLGVRAQMAPAANSNGGGTTVIVNNYSGEKTEQRRSTDGNGREIIEVVVGEVRDNMASGGFDKVMGGRFGSRPARVRR